MKINAIVLAAGKGTRMRSLSNEVSKVGFEVLGKPLINWVLDASRSQVNGRTVVIVGFGGKHTVSLVEGKAEIAWQHEQLGTGHAIMQAAPLLKDEEGITLILSGDVPLITEQSLAAMVEHHQNDQFDLTILTAIPTNPHGYGRIIRTENNQVSKIVEQADLLPTELSVCEVNAGIYLFDNKKLFAELENLNTNNKQGELYLTDTISLFKAKNLKVGAYVLKDANEMLGTNDRVQLAEAAEFLKTRINRQHMLNGVTIEDPRNTYIGPDVVIGQDTIIRPNTIILGNSVIGTTNIIGPSTYLENMKVGNNNHINQSHLVNSTIGDENNVGPFARLRNNVLIHNHVKVGNFVELKKSTLHEGVKVSHLTYLGDSELAPHVNIGAGTITANYDGMNKFKTMIEEGAFIGSNSTLIAPIRIGKGAYVAAGSTLNKDVPEDAMGIARMRQENKSGYATVVREIAKAKKNK